MEVPIEVRGNTLAYVSRGGLKLEKADLVAMIPYLATVIGLVIVSARKQAKARKLQAAD